uniref:beta-1,4-galactosyltransferase 3-like n=1 Tax=Doryrhamphus excisus TaxID=161450 RepID=UPI0025AE5207|nr:beta-1,4-galactosyltransferase 3-like [Doryrhamphus excisus]
MSLALIMVVTIVMVLLSWEDSPKMVSYSKWDGVGTSGQRNGEVYCPKTFPLIGTQINISFPLELTLAQVQEKNPLVVRGGGYRPLDCKAHQRTAIIIPHRAREQHLRFLLHYLHPFLQRQQLSYRIYVIHQAGDYTFNKARLMNVGFREAMSDEDWDCLFFHDVDLIPEDNRNTYMCDSSPKHFAIAIDKFDYKLPYEKYFGGVTAFTPDQYRKINGFPNNYWGWGCEDDDIEIRVSLAGMPTTRPSLEVGHYKMIKHKRDKGNPDNPQRWAVLNMTHQMWRQDGMNTLEYELLYRADLPLYTNITVNIGTKAGLHSPPQMLLSPVHPTAEAPAKDGK